MKYPTAREKVAVAIGLVFGIFVMVCVEYLRGEFLRHEAASITQEICELELSNDALRRPWSDPPLTQEQLKQLKPASDAIDAAEAKLKQETDRRGPSPPPVYYPQKTTWSIDELRAMQEDPLEVLVFKAKESYVSQVDALQEPFRVAGKARRAQEVQENLDTIKRKKARLAAIELLLKK